MDTEITLSERFKKLFEEYNGLLIGSIFGFVLGCIATSIIGFKGILILVGIYCICSWFMKKEKTNVK